MAGVYQIQPPVEDVVFGPCAVMTLAGRSDGGGAVSGSYEFSGRSASTFDKLVGASASLFIKLVPQGGGSAAFVLSSRPIPGRNCLVIQSNFADLMDALRTTGGATVRFS